MSNLPAVWEAAKDVSTAVTNVVNTYYQYRTVRKQEFAAINVKIKAYEAKTYARESGEIIRGNIQEIATTYRFIEQQNLNGLALELSMEQLRSLSILLNSNLENFRSKF